MEQFFLFIVYLLHSIIAFALTIYIFNINTRWVAVLSIGCINGIADYLVKEIVVHKFSQFQGLHFITGILVLVILCYYSLKLKIGISLGLSLLAYIFNGISETIVIVLIVLMAGKETLISLIADKWHFVILGFTCLIPMLVVLTFIKLRKIEFIDAQQLKNLYRV
jgi:hypothetical protein